MKKCPKTKQKEIKNDHVYFKEYSKLYVLLMERDSLLKKMRKGDGSAEERTSLIVSAKSIKRCRNEFWKKVKKGKENGSDYLFEKIAEKCGFKEMEKRFVLFFVSLTNCINKDAFREVNEVVDMFDFSGSVLQRARLAGIIEGENGLAKRGMVKKKTGSSWETTGYFIDNEFYCSIVKVLDGETLDILNQYEKDADLQGSKKKQETSSVGEVKEAAYTFNDVIVQEETINEVKMFLDMAQGKEADKFGIFNKIKTGRGTGFLFYGPPGTGKSMMAEAVASFAGKKVLKIECAKIMSRYIGDTDKKIAEIFKSAKEKDLVIILDEADSLLYDRSYAQADHDIRFVNDMLQEIESYEGIIVLTTNMENIIDPALERRLAYKVKFDFPDEFCREKIWGRHIPEKGSVSSNIDYGYLSKEYEFSGGNIKNAVLNAARKAVSERKEHITMEDFIEGAEIEKKGMFAKERQKTIVGFAQKTNI